MIQTCFVVSGSKAFYSIFVVILKYVLQKQCWYKVQFLVVNRGSVIVVRKSFFVGCEL